MERVLAHQITYCGRTYRNSILELTDDGSVIVYPYEREIHSTRYYSGHIEVRVITDEVSKSSRLCVEKVIDSIDD